jgi:magnesium transporter
LREQILELIKNKEIIELKNLLSLAESAEILLAFYELTSEEQVIVFRLLAKDHALHIFEELDTDEQKNLLRSLKEEHAIEFVNELAPDDRVRLFDEMPASVAKKLLNSLSPEERESTNILMGYKPETAGRVMTTEFIWLNRDMTVAQALDKVRSRAKDMETGYALYITDNTKTLEGVISLKELGCAEGSAKVEDLLAKKAISVTTDTDQEEVAHVLKDMDLIALPVVDREGRMVGIVTIDDAIDILEEEATEDIYDAAGFADVAGGESTRSDILVNGNLWKIWSVRLPFLLISLAAGMLLGLIIEGFEDVLEQITVVAFFIPLIMDMGGNVGTQSSTVFARGVVLGHIDTRRFFKHFTKEIGVGLSIGLVVGIAAGIFIFFWQSDYPMLGLVVGLSLVGTVTLASLLGFLVPFVLIKFNVDQAAGSAPIITSIKDLFGILIYFMFVSVFLGNMM